MTLSKLLAISVITLALIGCETDSGETDTQSLSGAINTQLKALEKAKGVEQMLQESEQNTDEAMETHKF